MEHFPNSMGQPAIHKKNSAHHTDKQNIQA